MKGSWSWVPSIVLLLFNQVIITWSESKHMASPSPLLVFFHMCLYYEHIISIGLEIRSIKAQRNFPSENLTELCLNLFSVCGSIGRKYSSVSIIFIIKQYLIMIIVLFKYCFNCFQCGQLLLSTEKEQSMLEFHSELRT